MLAPDAGSHGSGSRAERTAGQETLAAQPGWNLLYAVFGDPVVDRVFSARNTVESWLAAERALAEAQTQAGLLTAEDAAAICEAAQLGSIDLDRLWAETRNVGYPILPLVRMVAASLAEGPDGRVHYGATTQDIMDTGLALQVREAAARLEELLDLLGNRLADLVAEHADTVMAARTHAQQAVPTTFGAKLAVILAELARDRTRLRTAAERNRVVSLFGAGGTAASLGDLGAKVRSVMADSLGLESTDVPWHVARDNVAEFATVCAMTAATTARLAQEVIALQRTEIAEIGEVKGHHRGASSTMPQKANPISSEVVVGAASYAASLAPAIYRAMTPGHERAAGEWHIEWVALPSMIQACATCLLNAAEMAEGLRVDPAAMRANLGADFGLVMSEAYMMRLADALGREAAHDLVYAAALDCRERGISLTEAIHARGGPDARAALERLGGEIDPESYLGGVQRSCDEALRAWRGDQ